MSSRANRDQNSAPASDAAPVDGRSRKLLRWGINIWLVYHLAAIVIAPAAVAPASGLIESGWGFFQPYLQLLYLNNGYHFFAPEPGESTLLAYKATRADGSVIEGRIPNRSIVPRLLYHRHFMLTEHMKDAPEELRQMWLSSYAEHLCRKYGAARVSLTGQIHNLPTMEMVRNGVGLDEPTSYEDEPLGDFECVVR